MPSSLVFWIAAAVLLFWTVGAYNRLMRLRAEANTAFANLEAEFSRQIDLVRNDLPPAEATQPASLDGEGSFWGGLHGAAAQFAALPGRGTRAPTRARRNRGAERGAGRAGDGLGARGAR